MALWRAVKRITAVNVNPIVGNHLGIEIAIAGIVELGAGREGAVGEISHWDAAFMVKITWS